TPAQSQEGRKSSLKKCLDWRVPAAAYDGRYARRQDEPSAHDRVPKATNFAMRPRRGPFARTGAGEDVRLRVAWRGMAPLAPGRKPFVTKFEIKLSAPRPASSRERDWRTGCFSLIVAINLQ